MEKTKEGLLVLKDVNNSLLEGLQLAISSLENAENLSSGERITLISRLKALVQYTQKAHAKIQLMN